MKMHCLFLIATTLLISPVLSDNHYTCAYRGVASQSDDQQDNYVYCTANSHTVADSPSTLTVPLEGTTGTCEKFMPDRDDNYLKTQFGITSRPYFLGYFTQNNAGENILNVDQMSENCGLIQRHTETRWGEEYCVDAQASSAGIVSEFLFTDTNCAGVFDNMDAADIATAATNQWSAQRENFFDIYPALSVLSGNAFNYTVDDNYWLRLFSRGAQYTVETSYCYGIGDKFAPPFHIPQIITSGNVTTQINKIYAPNTTTRYLCGYDCTADIQMAAAQGEAGAAAALIASGCGQAYNLTNDLAGMAMAGMILDFSKPRTCGQCYAMTPTDLFNSPLWTATPKVQSRYTLCQTEINSVGQIKWNYNAATDQYDYPSDLSTCGQGPPTSSATSLSVLFSICFLVVGLLM